VPTHEAHRAETAVAVEFGEVPNLFARGILHVIESRRTGLKVGPVLIRVRGTAELHAEIAAENWSTRDHPIPPRCASPSMMGDLESTPAGGAPGVHDVQRDDCAPGATAAKEHRRSPSALGRRASPLTRSRSASGPPAARSA
jgi:hypothetical protein